MMMTTSMLSLLLLVAWIPPSEGFVVGFLPRPPPTAAAASGSFFRKDPQRRQSSSRLLPAASGGGGDDNQSNSSDDNKNNDNDGIDVGIDSRLYRLRLSRATGIEWGTDLSFSFVYVRAMDPAGAAATSGQIAVGDQLCELRAVVGPDGGGSVVNNLVGAPFDHVMTAFATLDKTVREVDLVFFRGTKAELKQLAAGETGSTGGSREPETITITVVENKGGAADQDKQRRAPPTIHEIVAPPGCNVLQVLADNKINVYQSVTRWTNCKGKQLCGTCIVNITDGAINTNRKSMDEASTLRENPETYRLSCITFAYGDVTVETFPPLQASQWTR